MGKPLGERERARGRRFRDAAKAKGFTSERIGELVGKQDGTVRGYWRGLNVPGAETLRLYAEATEVTAEWLLYGPEAPLGALSDARVRQGDLMVAGTDPRTALDRIIEPRPGDPELTDEERLILERGGPYVREVLKRHSPGDWARLTADQKEAVLRLVQTMAQANPPPAPDNDAPEE